MRSSEAAAEHSIHQATRDTRRNHLRLLVGVAASVLAACGGNGGSSVTGPNPSVPSTARGTLTHTPPQLLSTTSAASLLVQLSTAANQQTLTLSGAPICDIAVYHIEYNTVGGAGEATIASGALMVPTGADSRCRGPRPIVLYAHGTTTDRTFNIADLSNSQNAEGLLLAAFFAARGDIVVAPNYAGYDSSTLTYHPFLVADQQSKDMIDALGAARSALPTLDAPLSTDSGRLFITGYSQGGYVAMATHRAMQAAGMPVTASAPMSGPYALAAFVDAVFYGQVSSNATLVSTLLFTGYQHAYGNIYADPGELFAPPYASGIDSLLPSTSSRSQLFADGKLPQSAMFSPTPPDAAYADITPATTPAELAPIFALGFGSGNLIQNSFRLSYLQDAQANPDGGFPTLSSDVPAANPGLALRKAIAHNDLRNWTPTAPTLLCGGNQDPTVFWLNTQLMQDYLTMQAPSSSAYQVLDLDAAQTSSDPYGSLKAQFEVAKQVVAGAAVLQGATDGGASAVADVYHSTLVPPFCLAAVISFFAAQ
jgi:poly(3-hydroxybutyrate) depolymerase